MNRSILMSFVAVSLFACGPDAMAVVGEGDTEFDGTEAYDAELTSTSKSSTWFPLQTGNSWTFKNTSGTTRTVTITQASDGMALLTGLFASPTWVGLASDASTSLMMWSGSAWVPLVRFGYATTSWRTTDQVCTGLIGRRLSTGTVVSTTAGSFSDTRTVSFGQVSNPTTLCAPQAFNELAFVPNLGLVSFRTGTNQRFTLVSATVNGKAFPVAPEADITGKLVLDKASYVSMPNTIRCITTPCSSNAQTASANVSFELRNVGSTAKTWQFATGCQFDVEIVSAAGVVVRRLSEGRACTFSLTSLTLGAGQSKVYSATIPLEDKTGLQLAGSYSVRAKLIPSSTATAAPTAAGSFAVSVLVPWKLERALAGWLRSMRGWWLIALSCWTGAGRSSTSATERLRSRRSSWREPSVGKSWASRNCLPLLPKGERVGERGFAFSQVTSRPARLSHRLRSCER